jgi:hypothetical protein
MYPEPHFSAEEDRRAQDEIQTSGFLADPWLDRLDAPVLGFNVAFHWPLPATFRAAYEDLRARLAALDPGAYIYPFEETHVTVATLVSFKRYEHPESADERRLRGLLPYLVDALDESGAGIRPFAIDVGAPVLVRSAAFLPILNAGGEVGALRRQLEGRLRDAGDELAQAQIPRAIHSTILRFRRVPPDPVSFLESFRKVAWEVRFGATTVDELMITAETRPYMVAGAIEHRVRLRA